MTAILPLIEEQLHVAVRVIETVRVRVSKRVVEALHAADVDLHCQRVEVERVPVNQLVDEPGSARQEGDVFIVPIYEEVLVKRWLLKEELRLTRRTTVEQHQVGPELLRHDEVIVARTPIAAAADVDDRSGLQPTPTSFFRTHQE